jgi:hypothetical protein
MFLIIVIMTVLGITMTMNASSIMDSNQQSNSVQALLLAESGVENAIQRFQTTACGSLTQAVTQGNGTITIGAGAGTDFDGATPLAANRCRVAVGAQITGTSVVRNIEAIIEQSGAITFLASSSNNGGGSAVTSLTIARPAGVVAGDVMLAQINVRGGTGVTITPPAGWVLVTNGRINSTTILAQAVYYKVAGASEPVNYAWSFTSGRASGGIAAFRGADNTTPVNIANGQFNASSTNINAPSITTTSANTMLVGLFSFARGGGTVAPPAGMTEAYDNSSGGGANGVTSEAAYAIQAANGATGMRTATGSNAEVNIGHLVALRPGAVGGIVAWKESIQ